VGDLRHSYASNMFYVFYILLYISNILHFQKCSFFGGVVLEERESRFVSDFFVLNNNNKDLKIHA
jgi:hypothetical protein